MKAISYWARDQILLARFLLVISNLLLIAVAVVAGIFLAVWNYFPPQWLLVVLALIYLLSFAFYPMKGVKRGWFHSTYRKRKTMDGVLVSSAFLLFTCVVTQWVSSSEPILPGPQAKVLRIVYQEGQETADMSAHKLKDIDSSSKRALKKEIRKYVKEMRKNLKEKGGVKTIWEVLIILGFILVASFLILLILTISCSLSCNGHTVLALFVGIGGIALLAWGSVIFFRWFFKWTRRATEAPSG